LKKKERRGDSAFIKMSEKPLLSIITVVYNDAVNLSKTIDSIRSQTFSDYELIVIDGESSDMTLDVIMNNEHRIDYWISEPDNGIYDAMNKGIRIARGEYIEFLNAGDSFIDNVSLEYIFPNNHLEYDVIYGEINLFAENGSFLGHVPALDFTIDNLMRYGTATVNHQGFFIKKNLAPYFSNKYRLKAELNWYIDILLNHKDLTFKHVALPIVDYKQGGKGYREFWRNLYEWICLVQSRFGMMQNLKNRRSYWKFIKYRYPILKTLFER
jgi:glycosyltransferase involved in cell wall biosynthesis